jgi:hypothetical protein
MPWNLVNGRKYNALKLLVKRCSVEQTFKPSPLEMFSKGTEPLLHAFKI